MKAIDLGLSVKWCDCNIGASSPEEYGSYFAWGEVLPKNIYDWSTYKWCNGSRSTMTKYCNNASYGKDGFTDSKTMLDLADDAARVNWGGAWRMPTDAECTELRENCTWTWTSDYNGTGVAGRIVTGLNGNFIFLPAAGCHGYVGLCDAGTYGLYWSSSLYAGRPDNALSVNFYSDGVYRSGYYRYGGRSVRPVLSND